ncbi:MAG: glycosyltransferase family 2 protein [Bacteroidales bacterium]|nr:glycosyltransferase family 2 protein [Bacteroidales bacterium]
MTPLVSIIMPCYNAERYIAQSIESVLAQTYQNWELLITDDGSTDRSVDIVSRYSKHDDRINVLVPDEHSGIARTRNMSIARAKGKFVAFLDSDDIWYPEKLEKQVNFMLENNVAFTYSSYEIIDVQGKLKKKIVKDAGVMSYKKYLRNTIICCGTVVVDREKTGHFATPIIKTSEDMSLWLSIMKRGFDAYPVPGPLHRYRDTPGSASSNKFKAACDVWRVYRKIEKLSLLQSAVNFVCYSFNAVKKHVF